jgi:hypothetical protein
VKNSLFYAFLLASHCATVAGQERGAIFGTGGSYGKGYRTGVAEAEQQLEACQATIYVYGLRDLGEFLDRRTGLPLEPIAGCVVDNTILGRATGHNERIKKFILETGLPGNSFRKWEKELFDLKGYYEEQIRKQKPFRLTASGPPTKSADGKYTLYLDKTQHEERNGTVLDRLSILIMGTGNDRKRYELFHPGDVDCIWGPEGTAFAVIRMNTRNAATLEALDVERGKLLRLEYVDRTAR